MTLILKYRELIKNLVLKDLKVKYRDSVLGFFWSLVNPLLIILVYSFVFGHVLKVQISKFPYFIIIGILPWNFFAQSLTMSTGSILDNGSLIRKVWLPLEVLPLATVLFNLAQYVLALVVFFPMTFFFFGISLSWSMIAFFPVLFLHVLFTLGLSFIVSTATVFARDVRHFTEVSLMLLFWLTPIVYETFPGTLKAVIYFNPLTHFILSYQDILYRQVFPSGGRFLLLAALSMLSLIVGYALFNYLKFRFAEEV